MRHPLTPLGSKLHDLDKPHRGGENNADVFVVHHERPDASRHQFSDDNATHTRFNARSPTKL